MTERELTALQRDVLKYAGDEWSRAKLDRRVINALSDAGLITTKRQRSDRGKGARGIMQTFIRRTPAGRAAIGLPPLIQSEKS